MNWLLILRELFENCAVFVKFKVKSKVAPALNQVPQYEDVLGV